MLLTSYLLDHMTPLFKFVTSGQWILINIKVVLNVLQNSRLGCKHKSSNVHDVATECTFWRVSSYCSKCHMSVPTECSTTGTVLKAFSDIIGNLLSEADIGLLTEDQMAEKLLKLDNLKIWFNNENVVTKVHLQWHIQLITYCTNLTTVSWLY